MRKNDERAVGLRIGASELGLYTGAYGKKVSALRTNDEGTYAYALLEDGFFIHGCYNIHVDDGEVSLS